MSRSLSWDRRVHDRAQQGACNRTAYGQHRSDRNRRRTGRVDRPRDRSAAESNGCRTKDQCKKRAKGNSQRKGADSKFQILLEAVSTPPCGRGNLAPRAGFEPATLRLTGVPRKHDHLRRIATKCSIWQGVTSTRSIAIARRRSGHELVLSEGSCHRSRHRFLGARAVLLSLTCRRCTCHIRHIES
jgi:hypothetical protein